jgi:hypothetical protein
LFGQRRAPGDIPGLSVVPAYDAVMADTPVAPAETDTEGERDWGRLLDIAGIAAGILLLVIVADIASDGKLISRRLHRPQTEEVQPDERDG